MIDYKFILASWRNMKLFQIIINFHNFLICVQGYFSKWKEFGTGLMKIIVP